jgi:hypothetical protein
MLSFNPLRDNARKVAENFSLQGDVAIFNELWNIKKKSDDYEKAKIISDEWMNEWW